MKCEKCGKTAEFQTWNGFWQVADVERLRQRIGELRKTADRWRRFLCTYGLIAAAMFLTVIWLLAAWVLPVGANGMVAVLILTVVVFAGSYYCSVIARKTIFPTADFTRFAFFLSVTVVVFAIVLVAVYAPPDSPTAGTIFFLVVIGFFGSVFFLTRITTDDIRRAIEDAQYNVNYMYSFMDGGQYWIDRLEDFEGGDAISGGDGGDFFDPS